MREITEIVKKDWTMYAWTPALLMPVVAQIYHMGREREAPPGVAAFGWEHFVRNVKGLPETFFGWKFYYPYSTALNIIGLVCVMALVEGAIRAWRRGHRSPAAFGVTWLTLGVSVQVLLFLAYYAGGLDTPYNARYYCAVSFFVALAPASAHSLWRRLGEAEFFAFSASMFLLYLPVVARAEHASSLVLPRETRLAYEYFQKNASRRSIVITDRPGQYTVLDMGGVSFDYARNKSKILRDDLQRHLVERVYALQRVKYAGDQPTDDTKLPDGFTTSTLAEWQITPDYRFRIAEVTNIQ
jgi:hypothetical protein